MRHDGPIELRFGPLIDGGLYYVINSKRNFCRQYSIFISAHNHIVPVFCGESISAITAYRQISKAGGSHMRISNFWYQKSFSPCFPDQVNIWVCVVLTHRSDSAVQKVGATKSWCNRFHRVPTFSKMLHLFASTVIKIKPWCPIGSGCMLIIAVPDIYVEWFCWELDRAGFLIFSIWSDIQPPEYVLGNAYLRLFEPNFEKLTGTFHLCTCNNCD